MTCADPLVVLVLVAAPLRDLDEGEQLVVEAVIRPRAQDYPPRLARMRRVAAPLAAVLSLLGLTACGEDGAEPGASSEATLVLDFPPNAVHAGIYAALAAGYYADAGSSSTVREPSARPTRQAARGRPRRLRDPRHPRPRHRPRARLRPGRDRADRPAAARRRDRGRPRRVASRPTSRAGEVGRHRPPLRRGGARLGARGRRRGSRGGRAGDDRLRGRPALAAGRLDAATAFWNAEGVALRRAGYPDPRVPRRRLRRAAIPGAGGR